MRKPLMAGNWKMNLNHVEAVGLVQKLAWTLEDKKHDPEQSEVVVLPPFTDLRTVQTLIDGDKLKLGYGAQDVSAHNAGAYTGEVSAAMLHKLGCEYVLVGHSERRQYHGEDDALINAKAKKALRSGITPIICVGEELQVREEGRHVELCSDQIAGALQGLSAEQVSGVVIAYEPVWAIGTGKVATSEDAQEVCAAIRAKIADLYEQPIADAVRILYGGSVKANNVAQIMAEPDVDGCLVGGASLTVDEFAAIARFYALPQIGA
ncbi:triose-phosphate isomerase [Microlunatus soli]|uniref:Triosephosphate isomerase n=1 Tax=Microlunatus soli TaxID=630515 RepID=A0A1H1P676_9ACTN|nr:triose-phosphate isomerase [Microlunatus soli]SDS06768.1 triosephosphate isomerase [Microlunatus soli]